MPLTVTFETIEDIKDFRRSLQVLKLQILQFQATVVRDIANEITIFVIHAKMRAAGFSEKIIDGTILDNIEIIGNKKIRFHIRSEYFSSTGFDVAVAREEGTDDHFIKPVVKKALHGGSDWPFFSKGHEVSGIMAFFIVRDTVKETAPRVQEQYRRDLLQWYVATLGGIAHAS